MSDFINTADIIGDEEMCDQIIMRTVTEYKENRISKVGQYAFYGCSALTVVDVPNVTKIGRNAFEQCKALTEINLPNVTGEIGAWAFTTCSNLKKADLALVTKMDYQTFDRTALETLILRSNTMCQLANKNVLNNTPIANGTGYIYVPRALLSDTDATKDYRRATNWSTYAAQIRAIEDYPDITGG
jgi:hypothetical protein